MKVTVFSCFVVGVVVMLGLQANPAAENDSRYEKEAHRLNVSAQLHLENVKVHGAKGDGKTDDTAGIQAAVDALPSSGGVVFFPRGTYLVSANIKTGARPVNFTGQGRASILKANGTSLTAILEINHPSAAGSRVSMITFHGSKNG